MTATSDFQPMTVLASTSSLAETHDWLTFEMPHARYEVEDRPAADFSPHFGDDRNGFDFVHLADPESWSAMPYYLGGPRLASGDSSSEADDTGSSSTSTTDGDEPPIIPYSLPCFPAIDSVSESASHLHITESIDPVMLHRTSSPISPVELAVPLSPSLDSDHEQVEQAMSSSGRKRLRSTQELTADHPDDQSEGDVWKIEEAHVNSKDPDWIPDAPQRRSRPYHLRHRRSRTLTKLPKPTTQSTVKQDGGDTLRASQLKHLRQACGVDPAAAKLSDSSCATRPTDYPETDETPFNQLITKRSRGRQPTDTEELGFDTTAIVHQNTNPTPEQLAFSGITKTGQPKRVFVCLVPGCNRCFRYV